MKNLVIISFLLIQVIQGYSQEKKVSQNKKTETEGTRSSNQLIDSLEMTAKKYFDAGKYDSSKTYYIRVATLSQSAGEWKKNSNALNQTGLNCKYLGKYDDALKFYDSALFVLYAYQSTDTISIASVLSNKGSCYINKKDFKKAFFNLDRSLNMLLRNLGNDNVALVEPYLTLGFFYSRQGDYISQRKSYFEALRILKLYPEDTTIDDLSITNGLAVTYSNIGVSYDKIGDYDNELNFLKKSITENLKIKQPDHPEIGTSYNNLSICYKNLGDYDNATLFAKKALEIRLKAFGENHPYVADAYNNLAFSFGDENPDLKLYYLSKSLSISKKLNGDTDITVATAYQNMAYEYAERKDYSKQLEYYDKVLTIHKNIWKDENPSIAEDYYNLATCFQRLGRLDTAYKLYTAALNVQKKKLPPKHNRTALSYKGIGSVYYARKEFNNALFYTQLAIITLVNNFDSMSYQYNPSLSNVLSKKDLLDVLLVKAKMLNDAYKDSAKDISFLKDCLGTIEVASNLIDSIRMGYSSQYSKNILSGDYSELFVLGIQVADKLFELTKNKSYTNLAFLFSEKGKALSLLDAVNESKVNKLVHISDSLVARQKDLAIRLDFYQRRLLDLKLDSSLKSAYENEFFQLRNDYDLLTNHFKDQYPEYYKYKFIDTVPGIKAIQSQLTPKDCLIEYSLGLGSVAIFAITNTECKLFILPFKVNFENLLNSYIRQINTGTATSQESNLLIADSHEIYAALIKPVAGIMENKQHIIIIPDGVLNYLPFETLIAHQEGKQADFSRLDYLIKKYEVSYHYSAALLLSTRKTVPQVDNFIGFAPVFDSKTNNGVVIESNIAALRKSIVDTTYRKILDGKKIATLPYTKEEIDAIVHLFEQHNKQAKGYLFSDANKKAFKDNISQYKYVHIATHGLVNDKEPQLSGIIFSQPAVYDSSLNGENNNGILYSGEMYDLNLDNTDLIVLSGCETGIGKLVKGEGIMSMARGLIYSGAPNIVFSLWSVPDKATETLMVAMYQNILSGKSYASALRNAKLQMIKNAGIAFPKNWGGFVLISELDGIGNY